MNGTVTILDLLAANLPREQIEHWCQQQARGIPVTGDIVLSRVLGKYLLYSLGHDSALTPHFAMGGIWEPWITMAIARHVRPGMRCLDVGACYGYYSVLMADLVGRTGTVDCYEPVKELADLLTSNLSLNGVLQRALVEQGAVGTNVGSDGVVCRPSPNGSGLVNVGGTSVQPWDPVHRPAGGEFVSYRRPHGTFDFIKVDTEGSEGDVWAALRNCFADKTVVCLEFTPGMHEHPEAFVEQIVADGFVLGSVGHDGVPRPINHQEALVPDTGNFLTLWLTRQ